MLIVNATDRWTDGKRIHVKGQLIVFGVHPVGGAPIPFPTDIDSSKPPVWFETAITNLKSAASWNDLSPILIKGTGLSDNKLVITSNGEVVHENHDFESAFLEAPLDFYAIFLKS